MPKETVFNNERLTLEIDGRTVEGVLLGVEVAWAREGEYVQLGTIARYEQPTEASPATMAENHGWYVTLSRTDINKLIRNLRRARDSAYGRDE